MILDVEGLACLGSFGGGIADLQKSFEDSSLLGESTAPKADTSGLSALLPARALRQMDHFTRLALNCALLAMKDAGIEPDAPGTGIVLASGYGPAAPTFQFLDSLIEHGELMASPLAFSHSVHNIPAASIALKIGLSGPCATICQLESSVASGLLTAKSWLAEGRVDRVLFGAVDEHTPVLDSVSSRLARENSAKDGRNHMGLRCGLPVSEGAAFFCLSANAARARRGVVDAVELYRESAAAGWQEQVCHKFSEQGGAVFVSGLVPEGITSSANVTWAAPAYGNIAVAQAFDMALALSEKGGSAHCLNFSPHGLVGHIHVAGSQVLSETVQA